MFSSISRFDLEICASPKICSVKPLDSSGGIKVGRMLLYILHAILMGLFLDFYLIAFGPLRSQYDAEDLCDPWLCAMADRGIRLRLSLVPFLAEEESEEEGDEDEDGDGDGDDGSEED